MTIQPALKTDKSAYPPLREAGIRHLRDLAGQFWTDHNLHDPGITLLEVLSYAITDLSYRSGLGIQDILYRPERTKQSAGPPHPDFFTAAAILPNHPITTADYRKWLISRIPTVKNAWIIPLTYAKGNSSNPNTSPYKGLYKVLVEFKDLVVQDKDKTKDVSQSTLEQEVKAGGQSYRMAVEFPPWKKEETAISKEDKLTQVRIVGFESTISRLEGEKTYRASLQVSYASGQKETVNVRVKADAALAEEELKKQLQKHGAGGMVPLYQKRQAAVAGQMDNARKTLNALRNLCEDFLVFEEAGRQDIIVEAGLEISPDTDIVQLLGDIYYQIDRFLDPPARFFTLEEALEEGKTVEELFEGPGLSKFIDIEALERMDAREALFNSEFVRLILGVDKSLGGKRKILNVSNLTLSNYANGRPVTQNATVCLNLRGIDDFQPPRLGFVRSVPYFRIYRNGQEVNYRGQLGAIWQLYQSKKAVKSSARPARDIPVPPGKPLGLETYHSLQNLLPLAYGIGQAGLPATASERRRAQAKQLKAYLLFFEQLLANYLSQLNRVKDLLSVQFPVDRTYFAQALENVPDVSDLLTDEYHRFLQHSEEPDPTAWTGDDLRKNQFLDHLIARFGEVFTDYGISLLSSAGTHPIQTYLVNKLRYLQTLPELSRDRSKAFNYLKPPPSSAVVQDDNISGLENKLRHLLNLHTLGRYFEAYLNQGGASFPKYHFRLRDESGKVILESETGYASLQDAYAAIERVIRFGPDTANYQGIIAGGKKVSFVLLDDREIVIARRNEFFDTKDEVNTEIERVAGFISAISAAEPFILIEHILLRPRSEGATFPDDLQKFKSTLAIKGIEIDPQVWKAIIALIQKIRAGLLDWYSLKISAIFIYSDESSPFLNQEYRNYAGKIIYREMPAHLLPNICWINKNVAEEFIDKYAEWRELLSQASPDLKKLDEASQDLMFYLAVFSESGLCN